MLPILPLIDLMLLIGWSSLVIGFVLKAVAITTRWNPDILSLSPIDFLFIAVASFLFAIALAARTWIAEQQPVKSAARRKQETLDAYAALHTADAGAEIGARGEGVAHPSTGEVAGDRLADPAHRAS